MTPTPEQLAKLPKWTQEHIMQLTRDVETWKGSALRFASDQPKSPFSVPEYHGAGVRTRFVPSPHNRICIEHADVKAEIFLPPINDGQRMFGIEIGFTSALGSISGCEVGVIPRAFNQIQLVHKSNMR